MKDFSEELKKKVKSYDKDKIVFTKNNPDLIFRRINRSEEEIKEEILNSAGLVFVNKQEVDFKETKETRYACYHIRSNSKGRCYILNFNHQIKVITAIPLGRKTLNKYRKRFKWGNLKD